MLRDFNYLGAWNLSKRTIPLHYNTEFKDGKGENHKLSDQSLKFKK